MPAPGGAMPDERHLSNFDFAYSANRAIDNACQGTASPPGNQSNSGRYARLDAIERLLKEWQAGTVCCRISPVYQRGWAHLNTA